MFQMVSQSNVSAEERPDQMFQMVIKWFSKNQMFQLKSGQIKRNLDQIQIVQRELETCVQEFQRARKAYHEVIY